MCTHPMTTLPTPAEMPTLFNFQTDTHHHPIRTGRDLNGKPWFVAQDICRALDVTNTARAISRLDADEKGVQTMNTLGGLQTLTTLNEFGLYALILRSNKPQAKVFKRWLTHDVLPAIRRDGLYIKGEELLLTAATREQLRAQLQELELIAAKGLAVKAVRGLNGIEEREARSLALKGLNRGRRRDATFRVRVGREAS